MRRLSELAGDERWRPQPRSTVAAMPGRLRYPILALLAPLLALAACSGPAATPRAQTASVSTASGQAPPSPTPHAVATRPPEFAADILPVTANALRRSWHQGCPVGPDQLRQVRLSYWGFDGRAHTGTVVVHRTAAADVVTVFHTLYRQRFPIRRMTPVDAYGGSDDASMANDNTSGFNCRDAVNNGPAKWSAHAYGKAVDVNPVENPYLLDGDVLPPAGRGYTVRGSYRAGMAMARGPLVKAFAAVGWTWGGRWSDPDYQHFSSDGG
jgi:D-alanyl-D-alanine carboxypeptidase